MTEEEELLRRVRHNCRQLARGWEERVEYSIPVQYGDEVKHEKRVRNISRPGLLEQLRKYQQNKDVDRNPKAARGAPRVKTPKMHPELAGAFTLDEITADAYTTLDRIFEEGERDRTVLAQPLQEVLLNVVPGQMSMLMAGGRPDLVREAAKATDKWVAKAKATLKMTVSDAMFADTVCGNCGGGLSVPWDNVGEVRCIGTPSSVPCGDTYPMSEWVTLYEKGRRAS